MAARHGRAAPVPTCGGSWRSTAVAGCSRHARGLDAGRGRPWSAATPLRLRARRPGSRRRYLTFLDCRSLAVTRRGRGWRLLRSVLDRFDGDRDDFVAVLEGADCGGEADFVASLDEDRYPSNAGGVDEVLVVVLDVQSRDAALQLLELADERPEGAVPALVFETHLAVHAAEPHEEARLGEIQSHEHDEGHRCRGDERHVDSRAGGHADGRA